ncbi:MAG TPA: glutaredoxin family protein [Gammaproteobacteria bacterium]|nr:glutaredoxin family protein [Gammaproteobacteria bacterium]
MISFCVYSRHGCHLCEDLLQQLYGLQQIHDFKIIEVDVDSSPQLIKQYGSQVPVVTCGDEQICHYFLDQAAILNKLTSS